MEIINQILLIQRITLSIIIILITIILSEKIFEKGNNLDINKEFKKEWKKESEKNIRNFIEFKKYQYNQTFWLVAFEVGFSIYVAGIILGFMQPLVQLLGWIPYLTLLSCDFYIITRFCLKIVPIAHERAINNIKFLLMCNSQ